jgi:hypothetical protein
MVSFSLPADYREFLLQRTNGACHGPKYGLLPLGVVPEHWARVLDYSSTLQRSFPIDREWVWEDDPDCVDRERRIVSVRDGVLLLGEEGCGARWVLVVRGPGAGFVWLTTGEGITPTGLRFTQWFDKLTLEGANWWSGLVRNWGPSENIWFAAHAIKKLYVAQLQRGTRPIVMTQSTPLCDHCIGFLTRAAAHDLIDVSVTTPGFEWSFSSKGAVARRPTGNAI